MFLKLFTFYQSLKVIWSDALRSEFRFYLCLYPQGQVECLIKSSDWMNKRDAQMRVDIFGSHKFFLQIICCSFRARYKVIPAPMGYILHFLFFFFFTIFHKINLNILRRYLSQSSWDVVNNLQLDASTIIKKKFQMWPVFFCLFVFNVVKVTQYKTYYLNHA